MGRGTRHPDRGLTLAAVGAALLVALAALLALAPPAYASDGSSSPSGETATGDPASEPSDPTTTPSEPEPAPADTGSEPAPPAEAESGGDEEPAPEESPPADSSDTGSGGEPAEAPADDGAGDAGSTAGSEPAAPACEPDPAACPEETAPPNPCGGDAPAATQTCTAAPPSAELPAPAPAPATQPTVGAPDSAPLVEFAPEPASKSIALDVPQTAPRELGLVDLTFAEPVTLATTTQADSPAPAAGEDAGDVLTAGVALITADLSASTDAYPLVFVPLPASVDVRDQTVPARRSAARGHIDPAATKEPEDSRPAEPRIEPVSPGIGSRRGLQPASGSPGGAAADQSGRFFAVVTLQAELPVPDFPSPPDPTEEVLTPLAVVVPLQRPG